MQGTIKHILNQRTKRDSLNILTFPTHERYQQGFSDLPHTFYLYQGQGIKDWKEKYGVLPKNHILLPPEVIPIDVTFDLVLSQNKFGQFAVADQLSKSLSIPMISLEHTLPVPEWDQSVRSQLRNMRGDLNVFISEFSMKEWGFYDVNNTCIIHHMVDTDVFKPYDKGMLAFTDPQKIAFLSVVNDWINRDWCCGFKKWQRITHNMPVAVIGDTPGLSKPAKSIEELAGFYRQSKFFVNTSTVSPVPTALLEAMASGCICVSTATCMIPEVIENGVNGFISNSESELRKMCEELLANPYKYDHIGENARKTIIEKFNKSNFIKSWDEAFRSVV